jgi:ribonuclease J
MVQITAYGGAGEIGGNKILLEDRDTRLFLDFGEPFRLKDKYFAEWLEPRESRTGLKDYFHFDLMPKIDGLYGEDWLSGTDLKYSPPDFDGILISHMHFDHAMHLKFADDGIPVHLGAAADTIRQSWQETGGRMISFGEHDFRTFRSGKRFKVGSIEVEPVHVDHSVPGAYGMLLHTSEGCVAYTGDMRLHGPRADMTKEFISKAAAEKPIALITEGTRVAPKDKRVHMTEKNVEEMSRRLISDCRKMAIVSFYPKDVDRMRTFRDVARATGRKFVVSTKVAHLLESLKKDPHIDVPDPMSDPNMLVYVRKGMKKPLPYDRRYMEDTAPGSHVVDCEYVAKHQDRLIFHTDFSQLAELIDIRPSGKSLFIRSKSEPFEEDDIEEAVLKAWIKSFDLRFEQAHASGHAKMEEIFQMVKTISPKIVVPVHTEYPRMFRQCWPRVSIPLARKTMQLG